MNFIFTSLNLFCNLYSDIEHCVFMRNASALRIFFNARSDSFLRQTTKELQ